jgi:protoheme ferro-lyase
VAVQSSCFSITENISRIEFVLLLGWKMSKKEVLAEYAAIGNATHFRANSAAQAELVAQKLRAQGIHAKAYIGFTMTTPHISESRLNSEFGGLSPSDVCTVLPAHGNPTIYNDRGDPAYDQMMRVFRSVQKRFSEHSVFYGFQNHSEFPGSRWTQPAMSAVMKEVGAAPCQNVLINGRTSFTVDSLETLYDHAIGEVEDLHLAVEALQGEGDIAEL